MRCDDARARLSAAFDGQGELGEAAPHVASCPSCTAYRQALGDIRQRLRFEVLDDPPDVAPRLPGRRRPAWPTAVAAAVAGALVGAALVGGTSLGRGPAPARADLAPRVLAAQADVESLRVAFDVVERGFATGVPERRFVADLVYEAPEGLTLRVHDVTEYPHARWPANDATVVVRGDQSWAEGLAACPRDALPDCIPSAPRREAVVGREPFAPDLPAPLDLVVPVRTLALGGAVPDLGTEEVAGRVAVGVRVTVAQLAPLLDGLRRVGAWRELYPGDEAELWVDRATLVPLMVVVRAGEGADRDLWAAARGYGEEPGAVLFELRARLVTLNEPAQGEAFPLPPAGVAARDAGFREGRALGVLPEPGWLPGGMAPHRRGAVGAVEVATWTDGRAWVKVSATAAWAGGRLFGVDAAVEAVARRPLPADAGVAYVGDGGSVVALHGQGIDVAVTGTASPADLVRVAASLGVRGEAVPPEWAEAASASLAGARRALPRLLVPALPSPAVRAAGGVVTLAYTGGGDRTLVVVQSPGARLSPPLEPDVRALHVRGRLARWSPELGRLEWVEDGIVVELRSRTLSLAELVEVAEGMEGGP
jgi:hypothetical protein